MEQGHSIGSRPPPPPCERVRLQVVPIALPRQAGTYNCCSKVGTLIYERFKNSTSICTHSALLHPVSPG